MVKEGGQRLRAAQSVNAEGAGVTVLAGPWFGGAPPSSTHLGNGSGASDEPAADVVDHPISGPQVVTKGVPQVVLWPYFCQYGHQP